MSWLCFCWRSKPSRFRTKAIPVLQRLEEHRQFYQLRATADDVVATEKKAEAVEHYTKNRRIQASTVWMEADRFAASAESHLKVLGLINGTMKAD